MRKSDKIVWAQWCMRNKPDLAPGTDYCLPGSRWDRLMHLARMGASDRLIKKHILGIDEDTIRVARKIAAETASGMREEQREEEEPRQAAG